MCGRFTLAGANPAELRARFPIGESVEIRERFNVAPGDEILAVTTTKAAEPRGELLRWGLVPYWSKDEKSAYKMINARLETIHERPGFRDARHCLIIADGFYEWQKLEPEAAGSPRKQPCWVTRADGEPFAFAGLWSTWRRPDGSQLRSCSIVTTEAFPSIAHIHDRMPVILTPSGEDPWLHTSEPPRGVIDGELKVTPVGTAVNDARHDAPDCLDPPEPAPATLF
jgi:putative SOS response-associated peptidase YedK